MMRVADYIINKIYSEGAKDLFMVTGRGILFLTDAVAKHGEISAISVHNEQAGSYAAMAYAQSNEKIGACLVSTGCGATNAITGVLCAYQDSVPCIYISGQNMLKESTRFTKLPIRTYGSQEADIVGIVESITKYSVMLTDASKVVYEVEKALYLMRSGRPGPVWIDVPLDVQNMRIEVDELVHFDPKNLERNSPENFNGIKTQHIKSMRIKNEQINQDDFNFLLYNLKSAKRPVILAGNGIRSASCVDEFRKLVDELCVPVVYSPAAADVYGSANKYSIGSVGSLGGTREGNFTLQNSDLVVSFGCSLSSVLIGDFPHKFAREAKLIVIDIDEVQHSKNSLRIEKLINADVTKIICALLGEKLKINCDDWLQKCLHWKNIFPLGKIRPNGNEKPDLYYIAEVLTNHIPEKSTVICDAGYEELIIPSSVHFGNNHRCLHPAAQGAMGYALPAAIGAWQCTKGHVVSINGDGSVMMNLQELQTIAFYKMPIKIIIINNNVYSVIRKRQKDLFRTRTIGTNPENGVGVPNFQKVAECFGIQYERICNVDEVDNKLTNILCRDEAVICEIDCQEEQRYLHTSVTRGVNKTIVHRPLEDLSPFLERDLFLSEMIIEPIDQ